MMLMTVQGVLPAWDSLLPRLTRLTLTSPPHFNRRNQDGDNSGGDPCQDFFEVFVHMHSKVITYHQKVIFPHKSVPYSPEKIIQPHLFNIFTLKNDLRTLVKNVAGPIYALFVAQIFQDTRIRWILVEVLFKGMCIVLRFCKFVLWSWRWNRWGVCEGLELPRTTGTGTLPIPATND